MAEVVYGRRPVAEAERGPRKVLRVITADDAAPDELTRLAGSPDHQGIVAEVEPYPYVDANTLLNGGQTPFGEGSDPSPALIIALDQVQDPHNLGAVCRSAEAARATGVVICERRAVGVTPAVCKASAGAVEHLAVARVRNLADWLEAAKATEGTWIYGAAAGEGQAYTSVDLTGRVVLVMGSEGSGLRRRVLAACDALLTIPIRGRAASLNVSAAAAVLLFEAVRQRDA